MIPPDPYIYPTPASSARHHHQPQQQQQLPPYPPPPSQNLSSANSQYVNSQPPQQQYQYTQQQQPQQQQPQCYGQQPMTTSSASASGSHTPLPHLPPLTFPQQQQNMEYATVPVPAQQASAPVFQQQHPSQNLAPLGPPQQQHRYAPTPPTVAPSLANNHQPQHPSHQNQGLLSPPPSSAGMSVSPVGSTGHMSAGHTPDGSRAAPGAGTKRAHAAGTSFGVFSDEGELAIKTEEMIVTKPAEEGVIAAEPGPSNNVVPVKGRRGRRPRSKSDNQAGLTESVISSSTTTSTAAVSKPAHKKRRSLSCQTCRKLKTRCDYDATQRKCHRCFVLRLDCSLSQAAAEGSLSVEHYTKKVGVESGSVGAPASTSTSAPVAQAPGDPESLSESSPVHNKLYHGVEDETKPHLDARLGVVENVLGLLAGQMSEIKNMLHGLVSQSSSASSSSSTDVIAAKLDHYAAGAPLQVIRKIDYKLFSRLDFYDVLRGDASELEAWLHSTGSTEEWERLANTFINTCQPYTLRKLVPPMDFARETIPLPAVSSPTILLYATLVLQGMRVDSQSTHDAFQPVLFGLVRGLVGAALLTSPLRVQDLEALLYMAQFNAARKPKQPIMDSWLLSGYAVAQAVQSLDFAQVAQELSGPKEQRDGDDDSSKERLEARSEAERTAKVVAYLCLTNLQYAVSTHRPFNVPSAYLDMVSGTASENSAHAVSAFLARDEPLCVAELKLYRALRSETLDAWYEQHREKLGNQEGELRRHDLKLAYWYCRIIAVRKQLQDDTESGLHGQRQKELEETAVGYAMTILRTFLGVAREQVVAMPNYPLCILLYAVMTVCDFAGPDLVASGQAYSRSQSHGLSSSMGSGPGHQQSTGSAAFVLVVEMYWYVYHLGLKQRDIINSIARIMKTLVHNATNKAIDLTSAQSRTGSEDGSATEAVASSTAAEATAEVVVPGEPGLMTSGNECGAAPPTGVVINGAANGPVDENDPGGGGSYGYAPMDGFELPDIAQYATLDDFFEGMFTYVASCQNMILT